MNLAVVDLEIGTPLELDPTSGAGIDLLGMCFFHMPLEPMAILEIRSTEPAPILCCHFAFHLCTICVCVISDSSARQRPSVKDTQESTAYSSGTL